MKKSILVLVILALCLTSLFALTACGTNTDDQNNNEIPDNALQMDTEYNWFNLVESEINRFTFHSDGTGEYRVYYGTRNFTCHFIYEYLNEYKSEIIILKTQTEFHGESKDTNYMFSYLNSQSTLKVSKNVVIYTYLEVSPNYTSRPDLYKFVTAELQEKYDRINSELKEELNKDSQA